MAEWKCRRRGLGTAAGGNCARLARCQRKLCSSRHRYRTVYSLTTIPFLVARLPVVGRVLGHARPTAYTRYGKCVPKRQIWPWYPRPPEPDAAEPGVDDDDDDLGGRGLA